MRRKSSTASYKFLPQASLLSFEEITRVAASSSRTASAKLRLTGGERCCASTSRC
ncbi:MAG: hypothetical protein U1F25_19060 [Rubrivivax sp.]